MLEISIIVQFSLYCRLDIGSYLRACHSVQNHTHINGLNHTNVFVYVNCKKFKLKFIFEDKANLLFSITLGKPDYTRSNWLNKFYFLWIRSSRMEVFCEKGVLRNFVKSTEKHLCQSLFFNDLFIYSSFIVDLRLMK